MPQLQEFLRGNPELQRALCLDRARAVRALYRNSEFTSNGFTGIGDCPANCPYNAGRTGNRTSVCRFGPSGCPPGSSHSRCPSSPSTKSMNRPAVSRFGAPFNTAMPSALIDTKSVGNTKVMFVAPAASIWMKP